MKHPEVIVIDDDEGVRWAISEALSLENIHCLTASSGTEGLKLVRDTHPELAIVDVKLGSMNGLDVARQIHKINQNIGIIFITGYNEIIKEHQYNMIPMLAIIEKPFQVTKLLDLVKSRLEQKTAVTLSGM